MVQIQATELNRGSDAHPAIRCGHPELIERGDSKGEKGRDVGTVESDDAADMCEVWCVVFKCVMCDMCFDV